MNTSKNKDKTEFEIDTVVLEEMREAAREKALQSSHNWKQRGPYIVCTSCDHEHGFNIGTKKRLIGVKDGQPVFKQI